MKQFVHRPYEPGATIAAIATPPGEGGIAVIRVSGREAVPTVARVFSGKIHTYSTHTAHVGKILSLEGELIDEVVCLVMLTPRSYTGEDTVEIHCHGGTLITRRVFEVLLSAGARAAEAGEFTLKAFMNGKIDLAQAEAVQQLIGAKNTLALNFAEQQLQGTLSERILSFQRELIDIAAILEAWVDFPEEGLEFAPLEEVIATLTHIRQKMLRLCATFHDGKMANHGISLCLIGPPNVGKSSFMNALLGKQRAIVTPIAGTTRDVLEEDLRLGDLHFRLIDTAGIRETDEIIEQEGIRRSLSAMREADLILLVLDHSQPLCSQSHHLLELSPPNRTLVIWNKADLPPAVLPHCLLPHQIVLSAKTGLGLEAFHQTLNRLIWKNGSPSKEELVLTQARHHQALLEASEALGSLITGLTESVSPEFLSSDMRHTLNALGTIIGTNITEDILSAIFSKFCVGK